MGFLITVGVILVLALVAAAVVDFRDRHCAGERRILMPPWSERRGRSRTIASPVSWETPDYRPRSPRERADRGEH